jgi:hypothetical protein
MKKKVYTTALLLLLRVLSSCNASDLQIALHFDKDEYRIGDQMKCNVRFTNDSRHAIRVLPIDVFVEAAELQYTSHDTSQAATVVRIGEHYFDEAGLSKQVITLAPGNSIARQITAMVVDSLPGDYRDPRKGLFLNFGLSAVRLPTFGKYTVMKRFEERSNATVTRYLPKGPPFWKGVITSPSVDVDFKPH